MTKLKEKIMCRDYNRQIQKIVSNVASTRATKSFSVKNKARLSLQKNSIWHQNVLFDRYFVYNSYTCCAGHEISRNSCKLAI
jgi:hypothetical protein